MSELTLLGAILIIAGVAGVILPALPGAPLILLGAIVYDYGQGWQTFGIGWLAILSVLTAVSVVGDWMISNTGARVGGASWQAILMGMVGGVIGFFVIPGVGFLIGAPIGVIATEYFRSRNSTQALRAGGGWLVGFIASLAVEVMIAILMLAIILWRVF